MDHKYLDLPIILLKITILKYSSSKTGSMRHFHFFSMAINIFLDRYRLSFVQIKLV